MEWKFASTILWMEVLIEPDVVPPPFNIFPSKQVLGKVWQSIISRYRILRAKNVVDQNGREYTKMV